MKNILILKCPVKDKDNIKADIYWKTLDYIAHRMDNSEIYKFENNEDLLKYIKENEFSTVITTNEVALDTAVLLKGAKLVHILIGMREDLLEVSDIIVDPLVYKSDKYLVGTRYLLPLLLNLYPQKKLAEIMGITHKRLEEEVKHNDAEMELLDIAQLYQKLKWDSDFFGVNIGYISCLRLTPNIENHIKDFIRKEKIDLLEYQCNCHDRESVVTAEKSGYSFVDMRLTFESFLNSDINIDRKEGFEVIKGEESDISRLKEIATDIYKHSRYYFDPNFDRDKVITFYTSWVEKAILGTFDDYAYVLYHNTKPIGFCSVKKTRPDTAKIGLFGIDAEYSGQGLAKYLLDVSLSKLKEEGTSYVEVVTQGRNYAAQRLYQRCGFVTKTTELWYHKWFR